MLPNEKQLKSLVKKLKKTAEKKYEVKQSTNSNIDEAVENLESTQLFQQMKQLPFKE